MYFLSDPATLHCKHIKENPHVSAAIVDTTQKHADLKKGLQLWGMCREIGNEHKVRHALKLWKDSMHITDVLFSYENMKKKVLKGRMFMIKPKMIKLFDQELFQVEDGKEPTLLLS